MNSGSGNRDESTHTADRETAPSNTDRSTGQPDRRSGTGESIGRAFDSAGETLAQPGPKSQLTFVIGLFAVIGVGFGLTGIVVIRLIAGSGEGIGAQILTAVFLVSLLVVLLLSGFSSSVQLAVCESRTGWTKPPGRSI